MHRSCINRLGTMHMRHELGIWDAAIDLEQCTWDAATVLELCIAYEMQQLIWNSAHEMQQLILKSYAHEMQQSTDLEICTWDALVDLEELSSWDATTEVGPGIWDAATELIFVTNIMNYVRWKKKKNNNNNNNNYKLSCGEIWEILVKFWWNFWKFWEILGNFATIYAREMQQLIWSYAHR